MADIFQIIQYPFMQNAIISIALISIVAGIVGTFIVVRRMVFISGGITHASFGGLGIAYYFGFPPLGGAFVFAVATSLCIEFLGKGQRLRPDSAIAVLWSLGMSIGVLFMFLSPGYAPNLMGFMFGDVLTVNYIDIALLAMISCALLILVTVFYRPLLYVAFDAEFARVSGWRVNLINSLISVAVAVSIVMAIKVVGIILVLSLFTLPQAIANLWVKDLKWIMALSTLIGLSVGLFGLTMSYLFDLPTGALITAALTATYLLLRLIFYITRNTHVNKSSYEKN